MLFPWRALSHRSKQRFWCPERVLFLVDFWHREQTFVQAALWPGRPGAGDGRMLEAVPHLAGGLEGAQSSFLARGVLIAAPVQAVDHRLRGEAVHVCDHPLLRPKTPHHLPSPALSRTQTPPPNYSSFVLHNPPSLKPPLVVLGWTGEGCMCVEPPPSIPNSQ